MSLALEIKNLSLSYDLTEEKSDNLTQIKSDDLTEVKANADKQWIFKDLNFQIKSGEFILVAGPSGCGKSSLMNAINGVIPNLKKAQVRGDIYIQGKRITDSTVRERTKLVGSVFQNPREQIIFDEVADEIVFPMENLGKSPRKMREKLTALLKMTGLRAGSKTATLSGGEKQKLITACTLAMEQKILLLDEPLANMDANSAIELLTLLRKLAKQEDYTVVLIEHRQELVLPYIDRVFSCVKSDLENVDMKIEIWENIKEYQTYFCVIPQQKTWTAKIATNDKDAETVFSVNNMTYHIENCFLFNNFSWQVKRGDEWVILGENGCGKTTLLKLLIGFEKPSKGRISSLFNKREKRKKIGYVLQNPDYQLFMPRVKDELYLNSKSPEFIKQLIDLFGFDNMLERHPLSLSEGQKRKLGFACIIANEPEILFLDEPTVGLDTGSLEQLLSGLRLLKQKSEQDLTVISISHDKRAIPYLGNKFLTLSK
ncbi:MAG: ABC transporter ATP-binding protein [Saccharofermentanales bacterium]|jgi:energy-coupling factor transporter ATP-binding protein EcfA2